jgi:hypothetical protein
VRAGTTLVPSAPRAARAVRTAPSASSPRSATVGPDRFGRVYGSVIRDVLIYRCVSFAGANAGLRWALEQMEAIKAAVPEIGYADLYQLASVVAVEFTGGPKIPFRCA